ncbi:MAG: hypothetical protein KBD46_02405 [Candidatus Levybacteria bacterium]|nr:hypothetical protein [Candidatus Levybacteria bacterium]
MSDINLLPKKEGINLENDQTAIVFRRISLGFLSVTAITSIILFIIIIQSPLTKVRQQELALFSEIERYKIQMSRNVIINERLISISNLLKKRNQFQIYISGVLDVVPSSVVVTTLTIDEKTMLMTANTTSLSAVNQFFDAVTNMQKEKRLVKSVILQSFSFQQDTGKYNSTLKITFL